MSDATALSVGEVQELERLEDVVRRGLETFVEVGAALATIRDRRLYRQTHGTFEDYCRERWEMGRHRARQLIAAAATVQALSDGDHGHQAVPANERQARPLTKLPPEKQPEAWKRAVEKRNGKPAARHVEEAVQEVEMEERERTGTTMEDVVRRGLALENEGLSAGEAAQRVEMGVSTYRNAKYVVLLNDATDLSGADMDRVKDAVAYMNSHDSAAYPIRQVQDLVERKWGSGTARRGMRPSAREQKRVDDFMRAFGSIVQAMSGASMVEVPPLPSDQGEELVRELERAVRAVHEFRRKVEEATA